MVHCALYILLFVFIGAMPGNANRANRPKNKPPTTKSPRVSHPKTMAIQYVDVILNPAKGRHLRVQSGQQILGSNKKVQTNAEFTWMLRFRRNVTSPPQMDVIETRENYGVRHMCANLDTGEIQDYMPTVRGTYIKYKLTGHYSGASYAVLRLPEVRTYEYLVLLCTSRPGGLIYPQPGPKDQRWRYEIPVATGSGFYIAPGIANIQLQDRTAQSVADRWSTCCSVQSTKGKHSTQYTQVNKRPLVKYKVKTAGPTWTVRVCVHFEWKLADADVDTAFLNIHVQLKCVTKDGRWAPTLRLVRGVNLTTYKPRNMYGVTFRAQQVYRTPYLENIRFCTRTFGDEYRYLQPVGDPQQDYWVRIELIPDPSETQGVRKVMPGVSMVTVPQSAAESFIEKGGLPGDTLGIGGVVKKVLEKGKRYG